MYSVKNTFAAAVAALLFLGTASGQQAVWGQCGGIGYSGQTSCTAGAVCSSQNPYYFQCVPGTAAPTGPATTMVASTTQGMPTATSTTTPSGPTSTKPSCNKRRKRVV